MSVMSSRFIVRFRQRSDAIKEEAAFLVQAFGVRAYQRALRKELDANSLPAAHYWNRVESEVIRRIRAARGAADESETSPVIDYEPAWGERVRAQELASAIEVAHMDRVEQDRDLRSERRRSPRGKAVRDFSSPAASRSALPISARLARLPWARRRCPRRPIAVSSSIRKGTSMTLPNQTFPNQPFPSNAGHAYAEDRPDLHARVANALHWNLAIPRNRIDISVERDWVTLRGVVERTYEKSCAEALARRVPGVAGVRNEIEVRAETQC